MGFEPTVRCRTHAFQAGAIDHSATPPFDFIMPKALENLTPGIAPLGSEDGHSRLAEMPERGRLVNARDQSSRGYYAAAGAAHRIMDANLLNFLFLHAVGCAIC